MQCFVVPDSEKNGRGVMVEFAQHIPGTCMGI